MRILLATVLATLLAAAALLAGAPALAGGPTSVLITSPEDARATALYYSDEEYAALDIALHGSDLPSGEPRGGPIFYNLTWLVHDVSVWRTDRVAVSREGVWVATHDVSDGEASSPWREVADAATVRTVLEDIGMTGSGGTTVSQGDQGAPAAGTDEPEGQPEPGAAAPEVRTRTAWFSLAGWRWAVPGLLAGVLLTGLLLGRTRGPAEPRQQLVDDEPGRVRVPG